MRASRSVPQPSAPSFQILLRIRHPFIDPALISRALRIEPEHAFKAGQRRPGSSSAHAESFWLGVLRADDWSTAEGPFDGTPRSQQVVARVRDALTRDAGMALMMCSVLLRRQAALLRQIQEEGGQARLLLQLNRPSLEGFSLSSELLRLLGDVGVSVEFELVGEETEPQSRYA